MKVRSRIRLLREIDVPVNLPAAINSFSNERGGKKKEGLLRLSVARFSSVDERTDRRSENAIENRGDKSKACNIRAVPAGDGWN